VFGGSTSLGFGFNFLFLGGLSLSLRSLFRFIESVLNAFFSILYLNFDILSASFFFLFFSCMLII